MAKNTSRDLIVSHAVAIARKMADPNEKSQFASGSSFDVPSVRERIEMYEGEGEAPSDRTISDCLESIADGGVLDQWTGGSGGQWARYRPVEDLRYEKNRHCDNCGRMIGNSDTRFRVRSVEGAVSGDTHHEEIEICRACMAAYPDPDALEDRQPEPDDRRRYGYTRSIPVVDTE